MAKRGPRTAAGRRRASLNALAHGALARTPVIPGVEDESTWQQHLAGFHESLAPATPFEHFLVERIAHTAWRLKRLELYEDQLLAHAQLYAEQEAAGSILFPHGPTVSLQGTTAAVLIDQRIERLRHLVDLILRLHVDGAPPDTLSREQLGLLYDGLQLALTRRGPESDDLHRRLVQDLSAQDGAPDRSFAENLAVLLEDMDLVRDDDTEPGPAGPPSQSNPNFKAFINRYPARLVLVCARPEVQRLEHAARDHDATIARIRSESLLLDAQQLATITRYEAHLRRQLVQYLHELQALQSQAAGRPSPLARLDVQVIDAADA